MHVGFVIAASIASSVGLIMTNKAIMRVHQFNYVFTLTTCHFLFTYLALGTLASANVFKRKRMPSRQNTLVAALGVASIVFMNLSLRSNSVGFYQVTKLLTVPCMVAIQTLYYGKQFSLRIKASLAVLLVGVAVATVTDVELNTLGSMFGAAAVFSTAQFQIWQGAKQQEFGLDPLQINHSLSPVQVRGGPSAPIEQGPSPAPSPAGRPHRCARPLHRLLRRRPSAIPPVFPARDLPHRSLLRPRRLRKPLLLRAYRENVPRHVPGGGARQDMPHPRPRLRSLPRARRRVSALAERCWNRRRDGRRRDLRQAQGAGL